MSCTDQDRRRFRVRVVRGLFRMADAAERRGLWADAVLLRDEGAAWIWTAQRAAGLIRVLRARGAAR